LAQLIVCGQSRREKFHTTNDFLTSSSGAKGGHIHILAFGQIKFLAGHQFAAGHVLAIWQRKWK
jgi:hypothetical protein